MPRIAFPVSEIFGPTIQGEGSLTGQRTMFLRLAGCDGVSGKSDWCKWCDSMYAVDPQFKGTWETLTFDDIEDKLRLLAEPAGCYHLTITGGNPALYDLTPLIERLDDWIINVETQGTIWKDWLGMVDTLTVSPKPPSAGVFNPKLFDNFMKLANGFHSSDFWMVLKIVVGDEKDYEFTHQLMGAWGEQFDECWVSALTDNSQPFDPGGIHKWLAEKLIADTEIGDDVRVGFQVHNMWWGNTRGT